MEFAASELCGAHLRVLFLRFRFLLPFLRRSILGTEHGSSSIGGIPSRWLRMSEHVLWWYSGMWYGWTWYETADMGICMSRVDGG